MLVIVDYGMGNLGSISNIVKKVGGACIVSNKIEDIQRATKIVLPGVGSFDKAINNIHELGLWDILHKKACIDKIPFLGICLGMQLLGEKSEEGTKKGFGWISATFKKIQSESKDLKTPHMGWNTIKYNPHPIFENLGDNSRFYFVHSYAGECNSENVLCSSTYGTGFVSGIQKENILGLQFHPEKSHKFGMQIFKNFLKC